MSGFPVVIVESGGLPVTEVENGTPYEIADNGYGVPVTFVASGGLPLTQGVGYSAEALALFSRFSTPPTNARKTLINNLITSLKTDGVWPKLDALWLTAAADSQAAQRNWIADNYNLTPVSAPAFVADRGYTSDGATSYLRTGFNPLTAVTPKFAPSSAAFGFYSLTNSTTDSQNIGNSNNVIVPRTSNNSIIRVNNSGTVSTTVDAGSTDSSGYFAALRANGSTERLRRNASQRISTAAASGGVADSEFLLCGRNTGVGSIFVQTSVLQNAMGFIGSNLTDGESDALYAATLTYLQAVGAA